MHTALAEPGIAGADGVLVYEDGAAQPGMPMFAVTERYMQTVFGPIATALYGSSGEKQLQRGAGVGDSSNSGGGGGGTSSLKSDDNDTLIGCYREQHLSQPSIVVTYREQQPIRVSLSSLLRELMQPPPSPPLLGSHRSHLSLLLTIGDYDPDGQHTFSNVVMYKEGAPIERARAKYGMKGFISLEDVGTIWKCANLHAQF